MLIRDLGSDDRAYLQLAEQAGAGTVPAAGLHPLQLPAWGRFKAAYGWQAHRLGVFDQSGQLRALAQVLSRRLGPGIGPYAYCPRGPLLCAGQSPQEIQEVFAALGDWARETLGAMVLGFEPDWAPGQVPPPPGTRPLSHTVLCEQTVRLDLRPGSEEIFAGISKSVRKQIRAAARRGLSIERIERIDPDTGGEAAFAEVMKIYRDTAARAGFALHSPQYYRDFARYFPPENALWMVARDPEGQICAFLVLALSRGVAFELWGGMSQRGAELKVNPLLKWQAIELARELGCTVYDLNGIVGEGLADFKTRFSPEGIVQMAPGFGYIYQPLRYRAWTRLLPAVQGLRRKLSARAKRLRSAR